jgi:hypothetical protein
MTLKYVSRLNDVDIKNDGSFAQKKKKKVTPLNIKGSNIYAKILSKQYFIALALHIWILTFIHSACSIIKNKTRPFTLQANSKTFVANTGSLLQNEVMFWTHLRGTQHGQWYTFLFDITLVRHMRLTWMTSPINEGVTTLQQPIFIQIHHTQWSSHSPLL